MIVYDLHCANGHRFEGWFGSSSDFDDQQARGLVACPECGTVEISKAPMAPAVGAKGNQMVERPTAPAESNPAPLALSGGSKPAPNTPVSNAPMPAEVKQALTKLAEAQQKALKNSTWVGKDFASQSREMHYGERDETAIHGQATPEEAKALAEEGVPIAPLPFPIAPPDEVN